MRPCPRTVSLERCGGLHTVDLDQRQRLAGVGFKSRMRPAPLVRRWSLRAKIVSFLKASLPRCSHARK